MSFKKIVLAVLAVFLFQSAFGLEKWNILFVNLTDFSPVKVKSTGLTIQKSIASALAKQTGFNLIQPKTNVLVDNFQGALNAGRAYKADVILYGDYFIEGEDLVVVIDVFDVLENRLKMRKYYSGTVDLDIFDTLDAMSADMVKKVKEVLPDMTAENQIKIRQVRQNIYETEKVNIKRMFYTRFGFITEMGPIYFQKVSTSGFTMVPNDITGNWMKYSTIPIGFALRFWDIRLDLMFSGLPGVPQIDWQNANMTRTGNNPGNYFMVMLSYYLPWFNNSLALGLGYFDLGSIKSMGADTKNNSLYFSDLSGDKGFTMAFGLTWNPLPELEFSLAVDPFLYNETSYESIGPGGISKGTAYRIFSRPFPAVALGGIYFLGNLGFELKALVDPYRFHSFTLLNGATNYGDGDGDSYADITLASLYVGLVYRVDFINQTK